MQFGRISNMKNMMLLLHHYDIILSIVQIFMSFRFLKIDMSVLSRSMIYHEMIILLQDEIWMVTKILQMISMSL